MTQLRNLLKLLRSLLPKLRIVWDYSEVDAILKDRDWQMAGPVQRMLGPLVSERKRALEACHKAQQLQAELDALKAAHAWINASERLPEDGAKVLAIVREVMILVYDTDTEFPGAPWRTENADIVFNKSSIVKWMPIPGDT